MTVNREEVAKAIDAEWQKVGSSAGRIHLLIAAVDGVMGLLDPEPETIGCDEADQFTDDEMEDREPVTADTLASVRASIDRERRLASVRSTIPPSEAKAAEWLT